MKNILFCSLLLFLSACGSIVHGSEQKILFESNVNNVRITGRSVSCFTPCSALLKRGETPLHLTAEKEGYRPVHASIDTFFSPFFMMGMTTTGAVAIITDVLTGSVYKYDENKYFFEMIPVDDAEQNDNFAKTRRFILRNYAQIQKEISEKSAGEYLTGLSSLTSLKPDDLIKLNHTKSGTEFVKDVFDLSLNSSLSDNQTSPDASVFTLPVWVELYEKEGYTPSANQEGTAYVGYGKGLSYPAARNNAVEDAYNKNGSIPSGKMKLLSEYKRQSDQKSDVWVLYRYSKD